jgi:hypothetical protein
LGIPNGLYPSELARVLEAVLPASKGRSILGFRQNGRQPLSLHAVARDPRSLLVGTGSSAVPPQWQLVVDSSVDEQPKRGMAATAVPERRERKRWAAPQSPASATSSAIGAPSSFATRSRPAPVAAWPEPASAPRSPVVSSLGSPTVLSEDDDDVRSMSTSASGVDDYRRRLDDSVIDEENPEDYEDQESNDRGGEDVDEYDDSQLSVDEDSALNESYDSRYDDDSRRGDEDDEPNEDDLSDAPSNISSSYADLHVRGRAVVPQPVLVRTASKFKLSVNDRIHSF